MRLKVYSVFDKAVGAYLQPFYCRASGEAVRSFTEACNDPKNNFSKYAMDYTLVELGEFDDSNGLFHCHDPARVISAHELLVVDDVVLGNGGSDSRPRFKGNMPM